MLLGRHRMGLLAEPGSISGPGEYGPLHEGREEESCSWPLLWEEQERRLEVMVSTISPQLQGWSRGQGWDQEHSPDLQGTAGTLAEAPMRGGSHL